MTAEILSHFVLTQILIFSILLLAFCFRMSRWAEDKYASLLLNLPLVLLVLAWLGAVSTVGWRSMVSMGVPVLIAGVYGMGKPVLVKPKGFLPLALVGFSFGSLLYLVRWFSLVDPVSGSWLCTHHDDYSYIQQTNLLRITGSESHFYELIRNALGLSFQYKPYHYIEFYLILLFQKVFGCTTFVWFQFFIKTLLGLFGMLSVFALTQTGEKKKPPVVSSLLLFGALFVTLRFVLFDDYLQMLWPSAGFWKSVIFQNHYYAHPLAYFRGYKASLAFLYVLPVIVLVRNGNFTAAVLFGLAASIVSVGLLPIVAILVAVGVAQKRLGFRLVSALTGGFVLLSVLYKYWTTSSGINPLAFVTTEFQFVVNMLFENHYWQVVILTVSLLLSGIQGNRKWFLVFLLSFPGVYLLHGPLFKIFGLGLLAGLGLYLYRNRSNKAQIFRDEFVLAMILLYSVLPFAGNLPNVNQVFTNLTFLLVLYLCAKIWMQNGTRVRQGWVSAFCILFLIFGSFPALQYDIRIPLHKEVVPGSVVRLVQEAISPVRILSVARYAHLPHMDHDQMGDGLLNQTDQCVIMIGGLESLSEVDIGTIGAAGFGSTLERIPYYELMKAFPKEIVLEKFITRYGISIVLIQNQTELERYHAVLQKLGWRSYSEPNKGYTLYCRS